MNKQDKEGSQGMNRFFGMFGKKAENSEQENIVNNDDVNVNPTEEVDTPTPAHEEQTPGYENEQPLDDNGDGFIDSIINDDEDVARDEFGDIDSEDADSNSEESEDEIIDEILGEEPSAEDISSEVEPSDDNVLVLDEQEVPDTDDSVLEEIDGSVDSDRGEIDTNGSEEPVDLSDLMDDEPNEKIDSDSDEELGDSFWDNEDGSNSSESREETGDNQEIPDMNKSPELEDDFFDDVEEVESTDVTEEPAEEETGDNQEESFDNDSIEEPEVADAHDEEVVDTDSNGAAEDLENVEQYDEEDPFDIFDDDESEVVSPASETVDVEGDSSEDDAEDSEDEELFGGDTPSEPEQLELPIVAPYDTMGKPAEMAEESDYSHFSEETHKDKSSDNSLAAPTVLTVVNDSNDGLKEILSGYIGDNKVYLVDLSDNKDGYKIVPDGSQRSFETISGEEGDEDYTVLDIPGLIRTNDEKAFLVIAGADDIAKKIEHAFEGNVTALEIVMERVQASISSAYDKGITVIVTAKEASSSLLSVLSGLESIKPVPTHYEEETGEEVSEYDSAEFLGESLPQELEPDTDDTSIDKVNWESDN